MSVLDGQKCGFVTLLWLFILAFDWKSGSVETASDYGL